MLISLHKQATTTPTIRAAIQASTDLAWMVAERYGISEHTVWKWQDAPAEYGQSKMLYNRWKRWSVKGVFERMLLKLADWRGWTDKLKGTSKNCRDDAAFVG